MFKDRVTGFETAGWAATERELQETGADSEKEKNWPRRV